MLLNADGVASLLDTKDKGKKAQVGYDLTLKSVNKVNGGVVTKDNTTVFNYDEVASFINDDGRFLYQLEPGTYSLTFEQGCKLDERHTAFIRHRSSILRCGGVITSGVYDPGFEVDEMGGMLIATEAIVLEKGARVAQIIMMENEAAELYDGQWQKDKDLK
jgi:deoxycytidine triphosphate deaminase|tara:strand:- start:3228 stop:3710 length:483 start_codon:yes stop_codon:yes gene_type:complete